MNTAYPLDSRNHTRRSFLGGSTSMLLALSASRVLGQTGRVVANPTFSAYPFTLGVSSGDPSPDGFVLWTRLAPAPLEGGGMPADPVLVHWRVCEDEAMTREVAKGTETASPDWAHSVHVEVAGLKPDRWYWYEFKSGRETSPRARTRTLAPADSPAEKTSPLKMTFASCQHYETGYYTAYEHMLAESPDIVFHLGDYIYEGPGRDGQVRKHTGATELSTLLEYRNRHAQYRTDPALQAIHHAAPWVVTWDDHEVENNYAGDIPQKKNPDREAFRRRRAAAYQAYYEHMPVRRACVPKGPDMQIYRTISHGKLVNFQVLDTRQYRTPQVDESNLRTAGPGTMSPGSTLLGKAQFQWLQDRLASSGACWNVLAQQVMMARVDRAKGAASAYSMDQWPGYERERRQLLTSLRDLRVRNPVVLTGDIHSHWANDLTLDFEAGASAIIGAEFVGTSISSGGNGKAAGDQTALLSENPCVKFHTARRGYVSCGISAAGWTTHYRNVDFVDAPNAPLNTTATFRLEPDRPGLQRG